jgi:hypothetical protein
MKTFDKCNGSLPEQERDAHAHDRLSEHNFQLLRWLIDYELRAAERYRRFVALLLVTSTNGCFLLKDILMKTKRESDRLFELDNECAILMSETDQAGAMVAVNRYKALFSEEVDLRFSIVSFPVDGVNCADLLGTVYRRLNAARMLECGAIVCSG